MVCFVCNLFQRNSVNYSGAIYHIKEYQMFIMAYIFYVAYILVRIHNNFCFHKEELQLSSQYKS